MTSTRTNEEKDMLQVDSSEEEVETGLITTLPPKQQRFIHLYVTGQYTPSKLAQLLDIHPNTVHKWLKRKDIQAVISDMQETTHTVVASQLKVASMKAINKLYTLMDSPIDGVALQAVKDVLDRSGHKPKNEIKVDKTVTTVEEKMKKLIDETIDAEFYDVEE
jgi:transposase-like protein